MHGRERKGAFFSFHSYHHHEFTTHRHPCFIHHITTASSITTRVGASEKIASAQGRQARQGDEVTQQCKTLCYLCLPVHSRKGILLAAVQPWISLSLRCLAPSVALLLSLWIHHQRFRIPCHAMLLLLPLLVLGPCMP